MRGGLGGKLTLGGAVGYVSGGGWVGEGGEGGGGRITRPRDSPIIKTKFCSAIRRGFVINR